MLRNSLTALASAVALFASAARAEDLLEVHALARAGDPVLAAAEAARGAAREGVGIARAGLLPQWSLGWQRQRLDGGNTSRELTSRVDQVLVDLGRIARLRSAAARAEGQDLLLAAARQDLAVRATSAYFRVLSATDQLATVQANEDAFAEQVRQAESRFRTGLGAQVDIEQARTYHALSRSNTLAARRALGDAREALAEITGRPVETLKPLAAALPARGPEPAERASWVERALRDNPALRAERLAVEASEHGLDAARAAHLPTVSLGVDSGRVNANPALAHNGRTETTIGISVSLPLFSGGLTEATRRQAAFDRDGARDALEQRRRQVARATAEQFDAMQIGVAQIDSTRAAVDAADRALKATQAGQELGTRTMTDLLLAIQTQAQARSAWSQARHQYVLSRLLLAQAAGSVDDAELAGINALLQ